LHFQSTPYTIHVSGRTVIRGEQLTIWTDVHGKHNQMKPQRCDCGRRPVIRLE